MAILAILTDLVFQSKIREAAAQAGVTVAWASDASHPPAGPWDLILLDLDLIAASTADALARLQRACPGVPIVGYCSHVAAQLQHDARAAGCQRVLPRLALARELARLLQR